MPLIKLLPMLNEIEKSKRPSVGPVLGQPQTATLVNTFTRGGVAVKEHHAGPSVQYTKYTLRTHPLVPDSVHSISHSIGRGVKHSFVIEFKPEKGFKIGEVRDVLVRDGFAILKLNPKRPDDLNYHNVFAKGKQVLGKLTSDPNTGRVVAVAFNRDSMKIFFSLANLSKNAKSSL